MSAPLRKDLIKYKKIPSWKYQNFEQYDIWLPLIRPFRVYEDKYLKIDEKGNLTIKVDYAWDGCSGPTKDDDTNMRAGMVHDALYQLMRRGIIPRHCRRQADKLFRVMLQEDGMNKWRAWCYWKGVAFGGEPHVQADPDRDKVYSAP